jgi:hypothetical protein
MGYKVFNKEIKGKDKQLLISIKLKKKMID